APRARPTDGGPDHRHGSRCPALDGAWVARGAADDRSQCERSGPHGAGAPAGDSETAKTPREAVGATPLGPRAVTHLRVQPVRRTSAGGRRQAADLARRGPGRRVYPVASGPAIPASLAEPVSRLASPPEHLCARRSVVLPSDGTASTDVRRGPG